MKNIYLDNTQIHDNSDRIGFVIFPDIQGMEIPTVRLPSFNRPNLDGAFVPNQLYGGRLISFIGKVYADTIATYRTRRRTLEAACQIKRVSGILAPITLKFKTMDNLLLQVEVYTRKFTFKDKQLLHGNFRLDLFAPSVYIESQELYSENLFIFSGGGMGIPMGIPMDMGVGGDVQVVLNNAGNIDTYPAVTFNGVMQNPTLTNETNGDALSLTYNLTSTSQRIEIDTVNRTALYFSSPTADGVNVRQYVSGDFLTLQPGNNNLKLVVAAYNSTGYANLAWRDAYSGV